ncbi:MAG: lipopolysaccharide biosynthesis protein RfbH [Candidatus Omnitrophota bacterium]|nr:MAG: lipopolysaccharide biosynthesis protein RfbH [Candidatus Omnitrophota bacterium]
MKGNNPESIKRDIFKKAKLYYQLAHEIKQKEDFTPGVSKINYAGRVYDHREIINLIDSAFDFWLTAGRYAKEFEKKMCRFFKTKKFYLVNSGSSANLVMVSALASSHFKNRLQPGDEIITPSITFPTTVTPIIQNQLVPVFVDCEIGTYNIDPNRIEDAIGPKTKAIFIPHTLGNPCNMDIIMDVAKRKSMIVIEDVCDALGASYDGKLAGTFGSMASLSFFPAHHITMGEGGGIAVNDQRFTKIALSIRDWGRDCWCEPGKNDTCSQRFNGRFGNLPFGYDHKYVYSNLGYNFKITEMQAAIGVAQFEKLNQFIESRRNNFNYYYEHLKPFQDKIVLPRWEKKANPSWFGFPITVKPGINVHSLIKHLEEAKIETRRIFAGNILKQPGFMNVKHRISGDLKIADMIMERTFFIGVYPGLTDKMKDFVLARFKHFLK